MSTPGKPRQSGIPTPGRPTGIPTPGRSRSTSVAQPNAGPLSASSLDVDYMSRAFADAINANDPARHRTSNASSLSISPKHPSNSGRTSAVGDRPPSVASSSSRTSTSFYVPERSKTPTTRPPSRPPSRHSDVFAKSTPRGFEVGDNVRIESLGFEGTLRYLGEIDDKPGLWAGVELSGGFAGKGKNNGAVNGKQYFNCPEKCGVFVSTVKLSAPTVGVGAVQRPPSVASNRGGRIVSNASSVSGRTTPSAVPARSAPTFGNGRVTPSTNGRTTPSTNGRVTPSSSFGRGLATPGNTPGIKKKVIPRSSTVDSGFGALSDKITAGSRASKYMAMTAQELTSRDTETAQTPTDNGLASPTRYQMSPSLSSRSLPSPSRTPSSPFATPKPTLNGINGSRMISVGGSGLTPSKTRPSLNNTPRARIPSAIAMPPPASPSASSRSISLNESDSVKHELNGPSPSLSFAHIKFHDTGSALDSPRSESSRSVRSMTADDRALVDQLQARVGALEYENERLRASANSSEDSPDLNARCEALQTERDQGTARISSLEMQLSTVQTSLEEQRAKHDAEEKDHERFVEEFEAYKADRKEEFLDLQTKLEESAVKIKELQAINSAKEALLSRSEATVKIKDNEINQLQTSLDRTLSELEEERRELGGQIDELREAGQETIALYEERLSTADSQRYDLETRIATLEAAKAKPSERSPSPTGPTLPSISATQIDNESLRDQVVHLQRKVSTLEDMIEDVRAASEREEAALRDRMKRLKEKEEMMKKEVNDSRREVDRLLKSEANAKTRVIEIEEALRESTLTLENAQGEVETLRSELSNLDGLVAKTSSGDLSTRVAEVAQRAASDRAKYTEEIARLQALLEESQIAYSKPPNGDAADVQALHEEIEALRQTNGEHESKIALMTRTLTERSAELESLKKRANRDAAINPLSSSTSSKPEFSAVREEVTGLKHIVQSLQKENSEATQRNKFLEEESRILKEETERLRQEVQILEENLDQSLVNEEANISGSPATSPDVESLQRNLKEQKSRFENELDQVRKRLTDSEMKNARIMHDLNKEISELEALVESKIYREDELEQELERMKEKLSRQKKSSKNGMEAPDLIRRRVNSSSSTTSSLSLSSFDRNSQVVICEICERPGHDIFNCELLKGDPSTSPTPKIRKSIVKLQLDLFCEDCEGHGHVAADCPHSLDVF